MSPGLFAAMPQDKSTAAPIPEAIQHVCDVPAASLPRLISAEYSMRSFSSNEVIPRLLLVWMELDSASVPPRRPRIYRQVGAQGWAREAPRPPGGGGPGGR